jgi:osmotically-inducible protein OsmY
MIMQYRQTLTLAAIVAALLTGTGCAVSRGQESVGAYVDDATITTMVKSRFVKNDEVSASAIKVETLNGTVMLSGFARSAEERRVAESLAADVKGVRGVRNAIVVRPS